MKIIFEEYGTAIIAMIAVVLLLGIVTTLVFGTSSPLGQSITDFANSICGGAS